MEPYTSTKLGSSNDDKVKDLEKNLSAAVKAEGSSTNKFFGGILVVTIACIVVSITCIILVTQRGTITSSQDLQIAPAGKSSFRTEEDPVKLIRHLENLVQKYIDASIRRKDNIREESTNLRRIIENSIQSLMNITERNKVTLAKETTNIQHQLMDIAQSIVNATKRNIDDHEQVKNLRLDLERIAYDIQNYTDRDKDELEKGVLLMKNVILYQGNMNEKKFESLERKALELKSGFGHITDEISNISRQITKLTIVSRLADSGIRRLASKTDGLHRLVEDLGDDIVRNLSLLRTTINDLNQKVSVINDTVLETQMILNANRRALAMLVTTMNSESATEATPSTDVGSTLIYSAYDFFAYFNLSYYDSYYGIGSEFGATTPETFTNEANDVTIALSSSSNIRLINGGRSYGRVEIFHRGEWGTVCDDQWDTTDGTVVCRMLGYTRATSAPGKARYGSGRGQIWLDNVQCDGEESSIIQCTNAGWGSHNCVHLEDASVHCV